MSNKFNSALDQLFQVFCSWEYFAWRDNSVSNWNILVTLSAVHHTTKIYYRGSCKIQQTCYTRSQSPLCMWICVCVCMYVCVCIYIYIYIATNLILILFNDKFTKGFSWIFLMLYNKWLLKENLFWKCIQHSHTLIKLYYHQSRGNAAKDNSKHAHLPQDLMSSSGGVLNQTWERMKTQLLIIIYATQSSKPLHTYIHIHTHTHVFFHFIHYEGRIGQ